jgi:hypothetical protein
MTISLKKVHLFVKDAMRPSFHLKASLMPGAAGLLLMIL